MTAFWIKEIIDKDGSILDLSFGENATGDKIVACIHRSIQEIIESGGLKGGHLLKIKGACTLAGAFVIASLVANRYACILLTDPRMRTPDSIAYVCVASKGGRYIPGEVVREAL